MAGALRGLRVKAFDFRGGNALAEANGLRERVAGRNLRRQAWRQPTLAVLTQDEARHRRGTEKVS